MRTAVAILLLCALGIHADEPKPDPKAKANDAIKEVAGAAEFLRSVPKKFATYQGVDAKTGKVKLLIDGEREAKEWAVEPDAEIKVFGWWGRLADIKNDRRVWVWFKTDRKKQPASILMMADEISEQDIHGGPLLVKVIDDKQITLAPEKCPDRTYRLGKFRYHQDLNANETKLRPSAGDRVFVESNGVDILSIYTPSSFDFSQAQQKANQRRLLEKEGLPGTVTFVHLSGEADLMLDHETMRWARSLKTGDKVKIAVDPPINAVVKNVSAWRERTQVRVVINGQDLPGFGIGQRIHLQMKAPPDEIVNGDFPPDIDKPKTKDERIDWFLANTYCCCKVGGDGCTGHFYTLASCNPNACAAPNATRKRIGDKIDEGLSNKQIWTDLKAERGANMLKPHLAP